MTSSATSALLKNEHRGLIYFAGSTLLFVLISFKEISVTQLPWVYLFLLALFLFNSKPKLVIDLDWLVYGVIAAAVVFFAAVNAKYPDHALFEATKYRDISIFGFSLYIALRIDLVEYSNAIFSGMVCAFLGVAAITLWEFLTAIPNLQGTTNHFNPDLSFYGHIRHFSYHAYVASALATLCVINGNQKNVLSWLMLGGCLVALVVSTGRGAILGYAIFVLLYGWFRLDRRLILKLALLIAALTGILLGLLALSPASALVDSLLYRSNLSAGLNSFFSGRLHLWSLCWSASFEQPLLGYGPGGFQQIPGTPAYASQPHSLVFQLLLEFGWFGGTVIALCLIRLFGKLFTLNAAPTNSSELSFQLKCFLASYLIFSLVDGLFYHPLPLLHLAVIVAVLAATALNREQLSTNSEASRP